MTAPIAVLTTGGTIASTHNAAGALVPTVTGAELAAGLGVPHRVRELGLLDSSALTFADIDRIAEACRAELADPLLAGIVITHGTDSLEETAAALAARHTDPRPIVLTGAMRPADDPHPDGPANLLAAARAAQSETGVLVAFGGRLLPALGTVKRDTADTAAFEHRGPVTVRPLPPAPLAGVRVDIIAAYPGASRTLIDAAVAAGAHGLVIEALGAGNLGPALAEGALAALHAGIPVVITTRVAYGAVSLAYGGAGGGATLAKSGALSAGRLRAGQARVLLACALAAGVAPEAIFGSDVQK